jgi:acetyl-CoA hydrolase
MAQYRGTTCDTFDRLPSFEGLHDIVLPELPPKRKAFAINQVDDRIGSV